MVCARKSFGIFLATGVAMVLSACVVNDSAEYSAENVSLGELPLGQQPPAMPVYTQQTPIATSKPVVIGRNTPNIIKKGHIYMRRQVAYVHPPAPEAPEALEAKINRVVASRLQTSEAKLKAYAEQQAEIKARMFAQQRMAEAKQQIAIAMEATARAEVRSKQYTEKRLASTEKHVADVAKAAKIAEQKAIAFAEKRLAMAEKQIAEAKQIAELADKKALRLTEKRLNETQRQISELKLQAELSEERAKRYTAERIGKTEVALANTRNHSTITMEKTASTLKQAIEKNASETALALQKTQSAIVNSVASNRLADKEIQYKLDAQAKELRLAAELAEERAKRYTSEQMLTAQEKIKLANLSAELSEARAKAYADSKFNQNQQDILAVKQDSSLNAEKTKAYVAERLTKTEKELAANAVKSDLLAEKSNQAVQESKRMTLAYINQKYAENAKQLASLEQSSAKATADSRQASAKQLQELEARTQALVALVSKREAGAVEEKLTAYANQQLAKVEDRTMNAVLAVHEEAMLSVKEAREESLVRAEKIASTKAAEVEARLKLYTEQKTQDAITVSAITMQQLAEETLASAEGHLTGMAQKARVTDDEIKAITEATLADSSDVIRALALQTLADSEGYIKTVARGAVQDKDPAMQQALASAARQVILDEDNNVAFAIRSIVDEAIEEKAGTLVASANIIRHDGQIASIEDLDSDRLKIAEISEPGSENIAIRRPTHRQDWVNIRDYHVVVHEDNNNLSNILKEVLAQAEPFVGPWELKFKISKKHEDIMNERFSLDAETTFEQFANYLAQYIFNSRGVPLSFSMFDEDRILVVSDE